MNWFGFLNRYKKYSSHSTPKRTYQQNDSPSVSPDLSTNVMYIRKQFSLAPDLVIREFKIKQQSCAAALVYLEGLSDKNSINNNVLQPLMYKSFDESLEDHPVTVGRVNTVTIWEEVESALLSGSSVLFIEGIAEAQIIDTKGWPQRAIEDPQLESSLKGAHQGYVESIGQNIAMLRRYLPNRELKIKELLVGRRMTSKMYILYLDDVAHPEVLQELEDRIQNLDIDCVLNTGELAEFIEDNPYSPFPQFIVTERPDATASQILQGRYCVLLDRSSSALVAPVSLVSFLQSIDDYSTRWMISSFLRLLRFLGMFIAIFLPATYIALISYNFEVIPLNLILSIGESRAQVPFTPLMEALLMETILEMLREAGVRLPAPVGQTVGIVGGIVIGQAAVQAGLVSNIMVIVVAATAISSFIIPNHDMASAIRLIRFPMMILSSFFGLVGLTAGLMCLIAHLISLESLGTPYASPFAPVRYSDWKDTILRLPLWRMKIRPKSARAIQSQRLGDNRQEGDG